MSEYQTFNHIPSNPELKAALKNVDENTDDRVAEELSDLASSWAAIELLDRDQSASQEYELQLINQFLGLLATGHKWNEVRWQGIVNWLEQLQSVIQDMKTRGRASG